MVKILQVPSGSSNFYAAGVAGNPTTGNVPGGYFRGEMPYSQIANIIGAGEISLSGWLPKNQSGRFGYDISQQVDDFDIYVEGAATQTPNALAGRYQRRLLGQGAMLTGKLTRFHSTVNTFKRVRRQSMASWLLIWADPAGSMILTLS